MEILRYSAAFGGYLRELGLVGVPATLRIHQGHDLGRPGLVTVGLDADPATGVAVTGTAVPVGPPGRRERRWPVYRGEG